MEYSNFLRLKLLSSFLSLLLYGWTCRLIFDFLVEVCYQYVFSMFFGILLFQRKIKGIDLILRSIERFFFCLSSLLVATVATNCIIWQRCGI